MKPIYIRKETNNGIRKIMADMPYLVTYKKIRLPKWQWEEGLYVPYKPERTNVDFEKYFLQKDKIINEDEHHYFFNFPFKAEQFEPVAV
ncbi:MAG: hypothetical protein EHM47_00455 [Ignavibacteriales bacterium]|nr:MAG: hypothetical protein EHM47_00455 [Ignavibacteriales bacterium]